MEKLKNIWSEFVSFDNLFLAFREAAKGKRYHNEIAEFYNSIEENLIQLQDELVWKMYRPSSPKVFKIVYPKAREIEAPSFRDRVVQHALVRVIEPAFDSRFIYSSCACRKGKGQLEALKEVQCALRKIKGHAWFYSGDIHHYFQSIDRALLKKIIRKYIEDNGILFVIDLIIDSSKDGLPKGNLTSQLFANVYLNELDQYVKMTLRIKNYVRYMDNFVIAGSSREVVKSQKIIIDSYINRTLHLELNQKDSRLGRDTVYYCGGVVRKDSISIKKKTLLHAKRKLKKIHQKNITKWRDSCKALVGYASHFQSWRSLRSMFNERRYEYDRGRGKSQKR